jgi:hypothetical protein
MQFYDEDVYKKILFKRNIYTNLMIDALEEVKRYIIKNNHILVGGMAIDLALRSKGSSLYKDNTLADYDFITYNFNNDAYNIAKILKNKFPDANVDIVNAMHASTLRVFINSQEAADVTYIPESIYNKIPTFQYNGFRVVHPHYQVIDQHVALGLPYVNRFRETILGRWEKDMRRHNLITKVFPIKLSKTDVKDMEEIPLFTYKIPMKLLKGECLGGFAAISYWVNRAKLIDSNFKLDIDSKHSFSIEKKNILITAPSLSVYSDNFINLSGAFSSIDNSKPRYFDSLLEKTPRSIRIGSIDIYDNLGSRRSAYVDSNGIAYANLQVIMTHMLTEWVINKKIQFLYGYHIARLLVIWAGKKYMKESNKNKHGNYMLFLPYYKVYGEYDWSGKYIKIRKKIIHVLSKSKEPLDLGIPSAVRNRSLNNAKAIAKLTSFIPEESNRYKFAGEESKVPFTKRSLPK